MSRCQECAEAQTAFLAVVRERDAAERDRDAWRAIAEGWERTAHELFATNVATRDAARSLEAQIAAAHAAVHAPSSVTLAAARISAAVGP